MTIAGGKIVWQDNKLKVGAGTGKYIEMPAFSYVYNGIDNQDASYLSSLNAPVKRSASTAS